MYESFSRLRSLTTAVIPRCSHRDTWGWLSRRLDTDGMISAFGADEISEMINRLPSEP